MSLEFKGNIQAESSIYMVLTVIRLDGINRKRSINRKECGGTSKGDAQEVEENQVNVIPGSQVNVVFTGGV